MSEVATVTPINSAKKEPNQQFLEVIQKRDGGQYTKVHTYELALHILSQEKIHRDKQSFMYYNKDQGIWEADTDNYLKQRITTILGKHTKLNITRETMEHIKNISYQRESEDIFDKNEFAITLANGTYYLQNEGNQAKFIPSWNPYDYSTTKVNINFNEDMVQSGDTLPAASYAFLSKILDKEEIDFIFEWLGFCFIKGYPLQKLLILQGGGGNGKSTLINFVSDILGKKNIANLSLDTLENEKFGRAHLKGKLLNGCADINDNFFKSTEFIKGLTGNDTIYAEFKGKDGFSFTNFAKLIFSANTLPSFRDRSEGLKRRVILLPMNKKPTNEKTDITIDQILNDPEEMSRILYHAIQSIERVLKTGKFSITSKMDQALEDWFEKMDNVAMFVNEQCEITPNGKAKMKNLYDEYKWFCQDNNYSAIGKQNFNDRLETRYSLEKRRATPLGWHFVGIRLIEE